MLKQARGLSKLVALVELTAGEIVTHAGIRGGIDHLMGAPEIERRIAAFMLIADEITGERGSHASIGRREEASAQLAGLCLTRGQGERLAVVPGGGKYRRGRA